MTMTDYKQEPISIGGIWIMREGATEDDPHAQVVVYAEVDGVWLEIIRESVYSNFSHAVSPNGIREHGTPAPWSSHADE